MFKLVGKKIIAILHSILRSPPLRKKPDGISQRKMSEDMIDIPLALPPRKSMIKSQSVDESSPRNVGKFSMLSIENYFLYSSTKTCCGCSKELSQ